VGTLSTYGDVMQTTVAGTVVDQYGNAMLGVVICYGSGEEDAVAIDGCGREVLRSAAAVFQCGRRVGLGLPAALPV